MRLFYLLTAATAYFGIMCVTASAANATHGRPIDSIARERAAETCLDLQADAKFRWTVKKNTKAGVGLLDRIIGDRRPTEDEILEFFNSYSSQLKERCPELLPEPKEEKDESELEKPETNDKEINSQAI